MSRAPRGFLIAVLFLGSASLLSAQDLSWRRLGAAPARAESQRVHSFERDAKGTVSGWDAESFSRRPEPPRPGAAAVPMLICPTGEDLLEFVRPQVLAAGVDTLVVDGRFHGEGALHVELRAAGRVVASGPPTPLDSSGHPWSVALALPATEQHHDAVAIACTGRLRRLCVDAIHLESRPEHLELPELDAPRPITLAELTLPAGRLDPGERVALDVGGGPLEELIFSWARLGDGPAAGGLLLEWELNGETVQEHIPVRAAGVWRARPVRPAGADGPPRLRSMCKDTLLLGPVRRLGSSADGAPLALLMTSGSHRGDHWGGAFRGVDVPTPQLEALAGQGWVFADAQTAANHAVPAQAGLHTGLSPRDTGVLRHGQRLAEGADTLAEAFARGGYTPLAVVAGRHLAHAHSGLSQGFVRTEAPPGEQLWSAEEVVARGLALLEQHAGVPTFLWLGFSDGRWPHGGTQAALDQVSDPRDRLRAERLGPPPRVAPTMPPEYRDEPDLDWLRARYKASLIDLDAALAPLLAHPRVAGHPRVFVGDHGLGLGRHHTWFKPLGLGPDISHVPLLVAAPTLDARRVEAVVSTLGVGRTLLDLAGLESVRFPGASLLEEPDPGRALFAVESDGLSASIRRGDRLLVLHLQPRQMTHVAERYTKSTAQLYDLSDDWYAEEPLDLEAEAEGLALRDELSEWLFAQPDFGLAEPVPLDPLLVAERWALGYVGPAPRLQPRLFPRETCSWCEP